MKKHLILPFLLLLTFGANAQKLMTNLGRGIDKNIECSCVDETGNLYVGYTNSKMDSILVDKWDVNLKRWVHINYLAADESLLFRSNKCVTINDSLYISTVHNEKGVRKTQIFNVNVKKNRLIAEVSLDKSNGQITDLVAYKNQLMVFGNYDSIGFLKNKKQITNVSIYDGKNWLDGGFRLNPKVYELKNIPIGRMNDTFLIAAGDFNILQYVGFPANRWNIISNGKSLKNEISSITSLGKFWLITSKNIDSLFILFNTSLKGFKIKTKLSEPISVVNFKKGWIMAESGPKARLFRLDSIGENLNIIYQSDNPENQKYKLLSNPKQSHVYYISSDALIFNNINFGSAVQLFPDQGRNIDFDKITIMVFYDENNNYIFDSGEKSPALALIYNKTYRRFIKVQNGIETDIIPNFNDAEYRLVNFTDSNCYFLPFSGFLKSQNTHPSVLQDTIFFPLEKIKERNLIVKGSGRPTARMMDTISLKISLKSQDCDFRPFEAGLEFTLDSNALLVQSNPQFSSRIGSKIYFTSKTLGQNRTEEINIKVIYPFGKYNLGEYAKHKITAISGFNEDQSDNTDSILQKIVYSYDPNAKHCSPEGKVNNEFNTIRYFIEFQNEGNDEARRVTVVDTLASNLPVYEFQMINCSHPYTVSIKNNVVTWVFENINLPPKSSDEAGSQGFIIFEGRLKNKLQIGDSLKNKAYIYFDFNSPIITNMAFVYKGTEEGNDEDGSEQNNIDIYPNPTTLDLNLYNKSSLPQEVNIFNSIGQKVLNIEIMPYDTAIKSVQSWSPGMYYVKSSKGSYQKLLIQ